MKKYGWSVGEFCLILNVDLHQWWNGCKLGLVGA